MLPVLALALLSGGPAEAAEVSVRSAEVTERAGELLLSADVTLDLNNQLSDAAQRGLSLYFTIDIDIRRPRWYWFDAVVLSSSQTWRIVYNPLTRQWRVYSGNLALPVGSLDEALAVVRHVRNWRIGDAAALARDTAYRASVRARFDVQLSKAVSALNSNEWFQATPWAEFDVMLHAAPPAPAAEVAP